MDLKDQLKNLFPDHKETATPVVEKIKYLAAKRSNNL